MDHDAYTVGYRVTKRSIQNGIDFTRPGVNKVKNKLRCVSTEASNE